MVGAKWRFGACAGGLRPGKGLSRGMSPGMVAPPQKSFAGRVDSGSNLWHGLNVRRIASGLFDIVREHDDAKRGAWRLDQSTT